MIYHEPGKPENNIWHMMPIIQRQKAGWQFQQPDMNIKEKGWKKKFTCSERKFNISTHLLDQCE